MPRNVNLNNNNLSSVYLPAYPSVIWNFQLQLYKLPALDWKDLGCGSVVASWSAPKSTCAKTGLGSSSFFSDTVSVLSWVGVFWGFSLKST